MAKADEQPRRRYTRDDVIRAYGPDKRREELYGEWGALFVYRPVSFLVTPWLLNAGVGATAVTLVALALALSLPALAAWGGSLGHVALGIAAAAVGVLDCVDGNIARTTGHTSRVGHYLDFITDIVYRLAFYAAIALLVSGQSVAPVAIADHAMPIAIGAAWLAVAARLSRVYAEHRMKGGNPYQAPDAEGAPPGLGDRLLAALSGIDPLMPLIVIAAGQFGGLGWVLVWLLAYSLGDFLVTQITVVRGLKP